MAYWIFKVADQDVYRDEPGRKYVYDNTRSIRVRKGDVFLYLDKAQSYSFTATGIVQKLTEREPTPAEAARTRKVTVIYAAHLSDVLWFSRPLSICSARAEGKRNRARLGITDANLVGWSQSMPSLGEAMYSSIIDLAELNHLLPTASADDFSVPDSWSKAKSRPVTTGLTAPVLKRSSNRCVVCGSNLSGLVEAAHLSPYATDVKNRANPANGICLCKYCHRALDLRLIAITPDGELLVAPETDDPVAAFHFERLDADERRPLLTGVTPAFLNLTVQWHRECLSSKAMEAMS